MAVRSLAPVSRITARHLRPFDPTEFIMDIMGCRKIVKTLSLVRVALKSAACCVRVN